MSKTDSAWARGLSHVATLVARTIPTPIKSLIRRNRGLNQLVHRSFAKSLGDVVTIKSGPMAGMKLAVSQYISDKYIRGIYELETQLALDRLLQNGMVCYDLGASIGYMSLLMARRAKIVYAFEPAPHAAAEIRRHSQVNGLANVSVIPCPVSDSEREVEFSITDNAYGSSIAKDTKWPRLKLQCITIDQFARTHESPDLMKIDVEDEEARVLEGATETLRSRPPLICCEIHSSSSALRVREILRENGYSITSLDQEPFEIPETIIQGELQIVAVPR